MLLESRQIRSQSIDTGLVRQRDIRVQVEFVRIVVGILMAQNSDAIPTASAACGTVRKDATRNSVPGS